MTVYRILQTLKIVALFIESGAAASVGQSKLFSADVDFFVSKGWKKLFLF